MSGRGVGGVGGMSGSSGRGVSGVGGMSGSGVGSGRGVSGGRGVGGKSVSGLRLTISKSILQQGGRSLAPPTHPGRPSGWSSSGKPGTHTHTHTALCIQWKQKQWCDMCTNKRINQNISMLFAFFVYLLFK